MIDIHSHILPGVDDGVGFDEGKSSDAFHGKKTGDHRCVCHFTLFQGISKQKSGEAETTPG